MWGLFLGAAAAALAPAGPGALVPLKMAIASADSVGNDVYVAVVVDFGSGSSMSSVSKCVPVASSAHDADALAAAVGSGNVAYSNSGLLCAIDAYPANGVQNCGQSVGSGNYDYWSYWHGSTGSWVYANDGPAEQSVASPANDVEGWRYQSNEPDNSTDPPPVIAPSYAQICNASTEVPPPGQPSAGSADDHDHDGHRPVRHSDDAGPREQDRPRTTTTTTTAVSTRSKSGVATTTAVPGATTTTLGPGNAVSVGGRTHGASGARRTIVGQCRVPRFRRGFLEQRPSRRPDRSGRRRSRWARLLPLAPETGRGMIRAAAPRRRSLHPVAWWLWAAALAICAMRTNNPFLLSLIGAVACVVVSLRRSSAPWSRSIAFFLRVGVLVIVIRVVIEILFGQRGVPGHVLFTLPRVPLPSWAVAVSIGGPVTLESILAAFVEGLQIAVILLCFGAANSLASPYRLLRSLPAVLYETGVAVTVALSFTPELVQSIGIVRQARRQRGIPVRGMHGMRGVAVPVLESALDRSLQLATSMDARGYGRRIDVGKASRAAGRRRHRRRVAAGGGRALRGHRLGVPVRAGPPRPCGRRGAVRDRPGPRRAAHARGRATAPIPGDVRSGWWPAPD